jgi:hypothetical protein
VPRGAPLFHYPSSVLRGMRLILRVPYALLLPIWRTTAVRLRLTPDGTLFATPSDKSAKNRRQ